MEDELCGLVNWLFVLIANRGLSASLYWLTCFIDTSVDREGAPNPTPSCPISEVSPEGMCSHLITSPVIKNKSSFQDI